MTWNNLPSKRYSVVYADPPWSYYGSPSKWGAAAKFYETQSDDDILSFPMRSLMNERSVLFLWATSPRLDFAMKCVENWGLFYRGVAYVWVKSKLNGEPVGAQGVRPSIVKPTAEYVLAASTVKTGRPLKLSSEAERNVVIAPKGRHSEKPVEVMESISRLYPNESKIELFSRRPNIPGWDFWGDEVELEALLA